VGVFLQFPELSKPLIDFINLAQKLPGLSERARQVVILAIGGQFNVAYELYAHDPQYDAAVAKLGREGFDAIVFITIRYLALDIMLNADDVPVGRPVSQL
jgi:4-carboxymuconolactone decarboxylase